MKNKERNILIVVLCVMALLNLLQSFYTELAYDEAYYWLWSQKLDWGYLEHPPMVAIFIRLGYSLFENEIGVRLLTILAWPIVLYLVYIRLVRKEVWLYIALILSVLLVQVGGFFTAPDSPLFVFTALFYVLLKVYLEKDDRLTSVLLTLVIAAMLYSKYHGLVVIFFVVMSQLSLLRRKSFWLILAGVAVLFLPHVYWVLTEGNKGLEYALGGRFNSVFDPEVVGNYLIGQIAVLGPLMSIPLLFGAWKAHAPDPFKRSLKAVAFGMLGFFLLWSFRGRIEANWTASAVIPLVVLAHDYFSDRRSKRMVYTIAAASMLIFLGIRLALATPWVPESVVGKRLEEFHGWEDFGVQLNELSGDRVVYTHGYQTSGKLSFYTGNRCIPLNTNHRPNQFYLWDDEVEAAGDRAFLLYNYLQQADDSVMSPKGMIAYRNVEDFIALSNVRVIPLEEEIEVKKGARASCQIRIIPPEGLTIPSAGKTGNDLQVVANFYRAEDRQNVLYSAFPREFDYAVGGEQEIEFVFTAIPDPGEYELYFRLYTEGILGWRESSPVALTITE